jgi:hypothetical protein
VPRSAIVDRATGASVHGEGDHGFLPVLIGIAAYQAHRREPALPLELALVYDE